MSEFFIFQSGVFECFYHILVSLVKYSSAEAAPCLPKMVSQ